MATKACLACGETDAVPISRHDDPPVTVECAYCGALHESHTWASCGSLNHDFHLLPPEEDEEEGEDEMMAA